MVQWQSYYEPVDLEFIEAHYPYLPDEMKELYRKGDSPHPIECEDGLVVYDIPDIAGEIGSALNFLSLRDEEDIDSIVRSCNLLKEEVRPKFLPIARDGGSEMLLLKTSDPEFLSIWHYSPNFRLDQKTQLFKVSETFGDFLDFIKVVQL
ncbi:SMI1/KNR4 family protein [Halovulum sp. GXIMD14793]